MSESHREGRSAKPSVGFEARDALKTADMSEKSKNGKFFFGFFFFPSPHCVCLEIKSDVHLFSGIHSQTKGGEGLNVQAARLRLCHTNVSL